MKYLSLPLLVMFFGVFLIGCEMENNEVQDELTNSTISKSMSAREAFNHECDDECDVPCEENCETAFGYHCPAPCDVPFNIICFDEWGFNRWGWSIKITVQEEPEPLWFDLIAAAGQCERDKGVFVGNVSVTPNWESTNKVRVRYDLVGMPYCLDEVHFYIGTDPFPLDNKGEFTAAPGKYTYVEEDIDDPKRHVFDIEMNLEPGDEIYVIAHAVVCKCD